MFANTGLSYKLKKNYSINKQIANSFNFSHYFLFTSKVIEFTVLKDSLFRDVLGLG